MFHYLDVFVIYQRLLMYFNICFCACPCAALYANGSIGLAALSSQSRSPASSILMGGSRMGYVRTSGRLRAGTGSAGTAGGAAAQGAGTAAAAGPGECGVLGL